MRTGDGDRRQARSSAEPGKGLYRGQRLLEALALCLSTTRARTETRPHDRTAALAARHHAKTPGPAVARLDPFRWVPHPQSGQRDGLSPLPLQQQVEWHQGHLLRSVRRLRNTLDGLPNGVALRSPPSRRGAARSCRGPENVKYARAWLKLEASPGWRNLAAAIDSKSIGLRPVRVQIPPPAPRCFSPITLPVGGPAAAAAPRRTACAAPPFPRRRTAARSAIESRRAAPRRSSFSAGSSRRTACTGPTARAR
jgi:hypothetical protein